MAELFRLCLSFEVVSWSDLWVPSRTPSSWPLVERRGARARNSACEITIWLGESTTNHLKNSSKNGSKLWLSILPIMDRQKRCPYGLPGSYDLGVPCHVLTKTTGVMTWWKPCHWGGVLTLVSPYFWSMDLMWDDLWMNMDEPSTSIDIDDLWMDRGHGFHRWNLLQIIHTDGIVIYWRF